MPDGARLVINIITTIIGGGGGGGDSGYIIDPSIFILDDDESDKVVIKEGCDAILILLNFPGVVGTKYRVQCPKKCITE